MSYRGSMFAVVWRFYTAFKLAFMSMFYAVAAAWWLVYTVFIVTPTLLVCTQSIPRGWSWPRARGCVSGCVFLLSLTSVVLLACTAHLNCCWSCFKNVFIAGIQVHEMLRAPH